MAPYRLPHGGSSIDRARPVRFTFDGVPITGFAGDTVASALLGSGRLLMARSFKYHRPRGPMSAGHEEASALVTTGSDARTTPNVKATVAEIHDRLQVASQNRWPTLRFDVGAVNGLMAPVLAAGFYYKTFIGPLKRSWMWYEPFIRKAAGMGRASFKADPDRYETMNAFCDVLIVGVGVTGLAAALSVARSGVRVVLADENAACGGWMRIAEATIDDTPVARWIEAAVHELREMSNVTLLTRTSVHGYFDGNNLGAVERLGDHLAEPEAFLARERHWSIRARRVILATGMIERPLVFAGNDIPGVMMLSAGLAHAMLHGVSVGRSVAVFAAHDEAWSQAASLAEAGVPVTTVIDPRGSGPADARARLEAAGVKVRTGQAVTAAHGRSALHAITVSPFGLDTMSTRGSTVEVDCDSLLVSAGYTPLVHLASQAGGPPVYDATLHAFLPGEAREAWIAAGAVAGKFGLQAALDSAVAAARDTLAALGVAPGNAERPFRAASADPATSSFLPLWRIGDGKGKAFVDLQHDVTDADVLLAHQEGFTSVEHLKRYTTLGMANDQGRTSNVNGLAIMAQALGVPVPKVGTTRFRPPYTPVSLGALAGRARHSHMRPLRRTPLDAEHEALGASFYNAGMWRRPAAYLRPGETVSETYIREARAVRESVGICDVSTLGKIMVQGPDAGAFLDLVYTNLFSTLPVGKARYGFMLRDDGFVFDDGTTWRLSETDWLMTTTTANAGPVLERLEFLHATAWPHLKVALTSVTDQWAGVSVAGPNARALLSAAIQDIDFSGDAFPFMAIRHGRMASMPVMVARLSFSGELAYEIWCGCDHGAAMWRRLLAAGKAFACIPYGLEALGTLRIEKGHVTGAEMDGRTSLHDLGFEKMLSARKHCAGKALALRPALTDPANKQLVGLVSLGDQPLRGGAHLVEGGTSQRPGKSQGHVTAMTWSPQLDNWIALALLGRGRTRHGETLYVSDPVRGSHVAARIVAPCFFDKEGSRMHV